MISSGIIILPKSTQYIGDYNNPIGKSLVSPSSIERKRDFEPTWRINNLGK